PAPADVDCGSCGTAECAPSCPAWFGSVSALFMGRNEPNRLWTTYETGNNPNQLPTDARPDWAVGGEVTIGRFFCCTTCDPCGVQVGRMFGVEATYWGLDSMDGYSSQSLEGGSVSTPLLVNDVEFGGINGTVYFDSAAEHFVRRKDEFHNVEINLLATPHGGYGGAGCGVCNGYGCSRCGGAGAGAFSVGWALGVRYFRFEENYLFGSVDTGRTWGEGGGIYEAYLEDNVRNNLFGCQVGCDLSYNWLPKWRFFASPKLGIYDNHAENYFVLRRGDGVIANPTAASGVTGTYPVGSSEDGVAFLSELDLGMDWQVAPHWSVYLGYRVVFATGIALADNQVPTYVVDVPEIADIDTNGDLILHGAFAGVTIRF
ncbi:MAG: BBP7 family outer membrane beta-barrel protein, partial [Thermoguttaceae bacterium]